MSLVFLWGLLFLKLIFEWAVSPPAVPVFYDPYTCGKISGYVLRYPKAYVKYWPEYEGKSSWEPGFIHNKKGCGANLRSLTMMMSWPEMKPVSLIVGGSSDFKGLTVTIVPVLPIFKGMSRVSEVSLRFLTPDQRNSAEYRDDLGLHHVRGYNNTSRNSYSDFYWGGQDGQIEYVISCRWLLMQQRNSTCEARFMIPELEALSEARFPPEKIKLWREFVESSTLFFNDGLIGSE
ncbi:hypothetical protein [Pseudomonas sp. 5P_5.1_Bac1]|uniref:hypothetical protein n=1 Tax=Pseudomonas sp. 5P_5.1_Bac1 TaxID=2971616 RepID=UPI0021C67CFF|nr:hypothetical protein [Pseudomonas sp. 5P_5.1_Bac1]MCU1721026.1 hypothetical protein [Pseudomonas sp. 5P_5.1_Bac1]